MDATVPLSVLRQMLGALSEHQLRSTVYTAYVPHPVDSATREMAQASRDKQPFYPSIGPIGRSLRDIELILKVWNAFEPWLDDPAVMAKRWHSAPVLTKPIIGVMYWDEVVMPHPPIQRALRTVLGKLKAAGHEGTLYLDFQSSS